MKMFSDNAKTYIQLSGAALGLTLTFAHKIIHIPEDQPIVDLWMVTMWSCFLITIIAGAFYQYLAAKFMEASINWEYYGDWNWLQPGVIYGVMLGTFYAGTTIFTIYAIIRAQASRVVPARKSDGGTGEQRCESTRIYGSASFPGR
jgi:hypothetical protein